MAATSMAAALAATIPAPQPSAPSTSNVPKDVLPKTMAHAVDIDAEIKLENVRVDALALTRIVKHSREAQPGVATGVLLGLDLEGTLEVSNSFPLPTSVVSSFGDEDDKGGKHSATRYQNEMINLLREVRGDVNVVGFYQSTSMGAFYRQTLLDMQAAHQNTLRFGGIVLVCDVAQTGRGNPSLRAFRLSPAYLTARKSGKLNAQSLIENRLTFSEILVELPVFVRNSPLVNAFLSTISKSPSSPLAPNYDTLTLPPPPTLTKSLESVIDTLDAYRAEENNLAYLSRQIAREKARAEQHLAKWREENALRVAQGKPPKPEEDVNRLFKIPPEPSRADSMLLLGQLDGYAKDLESLSGLELVKMYAARAGSTT